MPFRQGGAKKRRDTIEPAIVSALRARGVQTWQISGRGLPDLLCWYQNKCVVLEVKSGASARLSRVQKSQAAPWPIVRDVAQAVEAVCGTP
jgi:Holliday junction resolvase